VNKKDNETARQQEIKKWKEQNTKTERKKNDRMDAIKENKKLKRGKNSEQRKRE
jgi:hypothetical protein